VRLAGALLTCQHDRPTLALELAACRLELLVSERRRTNLKGQLDHYIGQAIRARAERDRAEHERDRAQACLVQALADKQDAVARILEMEGTLAAAFVATETIRTLPKRRTKPTPKRREA
jgi:hypothetical protein